MADIFTIKTQEEYERTKARVRKAKAMLEGKWFNPLYEKWVDKHGKLGWAVLVWELDHDLYGKPEAHYP